MIPATGTSPNYTYTLINPVSIAISDADGRPLQTIQAVRSYTNGPLLATDSFPQSSYVRWTTNAVMVAITCWPASTSTTRFRQADRVAAVPTTMKATSATTPCLTAESRVDAGRHDHALTVFDVRDNQANIWVGTNDTGATDSDPTGGGHPGNNMVVITANVYDNGQASGDNNVTQTTQYVDASTILAVTQFLYDWRDRCTDTEWRG